MDWKLQDLLRDAIKKFLPTKKKEIYQIVKHISDSYRHFDSPFCMSGELASFGVLTHFDSKSLNISLLCCLTGFLLNAN